MVKISLNTVTRECVADSTFLGFEGENQANVLDFSFSDKFVDGTAVLNIKRGKDTGFVSVDKIGNGYQLPVKSSLLSQVGDVIFQFVITTVEGSIMKFDPFVMTVEDAIDTDVPLPEEYPSWVEMANVKLAEVDAAVEQANSISKQILLDKNSGVFDGRDGLDGANGVSPVVKTEQTSTGAKIIITDATGTHVAELLNGQRGETGAAGERGPRGETGPAGPQGPAGKDGTLTFEELTEEQKATLKGDTGPTGPQGIQGPQGPQGIQGAAGATGPQGPAGPKGDTGPVGERGPQGETGPAGVDGLTPFIGDNGNWWIGETDTGVKASGSGEGGSVNGTIDVLFDGKNLTTTNQTATLSNDIGNYDVIVVQAQQFFANGSLGNTIQSVAVKPEINTSYGIGFFYKTNYFYSTTYTFIDSKTIKMSADLSLASVNSICFSKVYGIKLGGGSGTIGGRTTTVLLDGKFTGGSGLHDLADNASNYDVIVVEGVFGASETDNQTKNVSFIRENLDFNAKSSYAFQLTEYRGSNSYYSLLCSITDTQLWVGSLMQSGISLGYVKKVYGIKY